MDSSAPRPPLSPRLPRVALFLLVAGFVAYAVFLARQGGSIAGGADSSGYLNSARLFGQGDLVAPVRVPLNHGHMEFGMMAFQPLGFIVDKEKPVMAPTYPTGLPLHLLVASWITGWQGAAVAVNIFAALGSGLILWHLARRLQLTAAWSAGALALLWLCPLTMFASMQPMSDQLAALWSLAALAAALRSREHWRWSLLAGLATSIAVLVRPTNGLVLVPVAVALGLDFRRYLLLALGGLPAGIFFCYYNWRLYGKPLATGYGDIWTALSPAYAPPNLAHMAWWIPMLLSPLVCAALAAPFLRAARRRELAVLGLWVAILVGFYAFYYHTGETWWYLRFILPVFPALILIAFVVIQQAWQRITHPRWAALALIAALAFSAVWQVKLVRRLDVLNLPAGEANYLRAAEWARDRLPPDAAILCMQVSGAFYFYTPFLLIRWDAVEPSLAPRLFAALEEERRPVYAVLFDFEQPDATTRLGGQWRRITTVGPATFWQLEKAPAAR
jgi:hypothetical protein